jgi:hypothetical protein
MLMVGERPVIPSIIHTKLKYGPLVDRPKLPDANAIDLNSIIISVHFAVLSFLEGNQSFTIRKSWWPEMGTTPLHSMLPKLAKYYFAMFFGRKNK